MISHSCSAGTSCPRCGFAVAMVVLAMGLLPERGLAGFIEGYAYVARTYDGGPIDVRSDSKNGSLSPSAPPLAGSATFMGSTASYNLHPAAGAGSASGQSATVTFADFNWNKLGSQANAFVGLTDRFTMNGSSTNAELLSISVNFAGQLFPNLDFEGAYLSAHGYLIKTSTAVVDVSVTFGWVDTNGERHNWGPTKQKSIASENLLNNGQENKTFDGSLGDPLIIVEPHQHEIFIDLTISGSGYMGGGFALFGIGGAGSNATFGQSEKLAAAASLEDSFFEIVVGLPPGRSISGNSAYIRQVTIPEPSTVALMLLAAVGTTVRRRKSKRY